MDDGPQIMSAQEAMKTINVIVKNESDDVLNQVSTFGPFVLV